MHFRPILLLHCPRPPAPSPCAHRSDTRSALRVRAALTFTRAVGAEWSVRQLREASIWKRCCPSCLWWLNLGQHVCNLRGCVGIGLNILFYVHILSVSDVDEFIYRAEPERSVDQRTWLRGWPKCDTCLSYSHKMTLRATVCESLCIRDIMKMTINWFIKWFLVITFEMFSLTKKRRSKEDVGEYSGDKR